jgi:hypothetical protein
MSIPQPNRNPALLLPGAVVQVRPATEIFATLDERGSLDGLPCMPEMLRYCGGQFRVWRRVEKTCVEGDRMRRIQKIVFLDDLRCGGEAHGGCDKECRLFWHEAWLRPSPVAGNGPGLSSGPENIVFPFPTRTSAERYCCQSTELLRATQPLSKLDLRQYLREWRSKTYRPVEFFKLLLFPAWIRLKVLFCGMSAVHLKGILAKTPEEALNLQPGDWVEVKNRQEIEKTLDNCGRNRGLEFSRFMLPFCGKRLRVKKRVNRIIIETSGEMREIKNTVILEHCTCNGFTRWGGCPRDAHHLWREVWLRRVTED